MKICNTTESNKSYIAILKKANNRKIFKATAKAVEQYLLQEEIPFEGDVNIEFETRRWTRKKLFTSIHLVGIPYEWVICRPETSVTINSYFFYKCWEIEVEGIQVDIIISSIVGMPEEDLELYKSLGKIHSEEIVSNSEFLFCES